VPLNDEQEPAGGVGLAALDRFLPQQAELARRFREASPFPHIVLEDFVRLGPERASDFPGADWPQWAHLSDGYQREKSTCSDLDEIPSPFRDLIQELCSPPFLRFLEAVTGVEKIIPDPYLEGGGLHRSGAGGHLAPHTDFHVYPELDLYRRLNVLVYLNPNWDASKGGTLVLGEPEDPDSKVSVGPNWGTCVIFETSDESVHGVEPVAEGCVRQSIALYYYTSSETSSYGGDLSTHWRTHGEGGGVHRARVATYRGLMMVSRGFSMLAHLVNPHFGMRMVRERLKGGDDRS
jgi:hypothetical protein